MRIIAITPPGTVDREVFIIKRLLAEGISIVHLRKPEAGIHECRRLLEGLDRQERARIIIHDYPQLYEEFSLKGIHVNKNITDLPVGYNGFRTRSCHSFEELRRYKDEYDYLFLSPIFDSISKVGYKSAFTEEELQKAAEEGLIDEKVIALGGVTFDKIPLLEKLNFGGAAMLGGIYSQLQAK
ncbi:MAG: thiamine phosphate synthase [Bacteroidales bacterium]|nr:thiamine phosphate synthase [Bacteroidales bacterium]